MKGHCKVSRGPQTLWERDLASGIANMSHSLANLEHHHFKYPQHRIPGDIHIHFWGADAFSFGGGVVLQDGDVMEVEWKGYGRALRNTAKVDRSTRKPFVRRSLPRKSTPLRSTTCARAPGTGGILSASSPRRH